MKYLHLGNDTSIKIENILGIFDLDTTTVSKHTKKFLFNCEKENMIVNIKEYELPKSFIFYDFDGEYSVYISNISSQTLVKRMSVGKDIL